MLNRLLTIACLFALVLLRCQHDERPFLLLDNSRPCTIVLELDSHPDIESVLQEKDVLNQADLEVHIKVHAAMELRHYLSRITGHFEDKIVITNDQYSVAGNLVFLGLPGAKSAYSDLRAQIQKKWRKVRDTNDQGLRIDTFQDEKNSILVLSGRTATGTLYAVYEWLNQQGVRWIAPGKADEIVPLQPRILVPATHFYREPDMYWRGYVPACDLIESYDIEKLDWLSRNRINLVSNRIANLNELHMRGIKGSQLWQIPVQTTLADGLCVSRAESVKSVLDSLAAFLILASRADVIFVDATRIKNWCRCQACAQMGNDTDKALHLVGRIGQAMQKKRQQNQSSLDRKIIAIVGTTPPEKPKLKPWPKELDVMALRVFPRCYTHTMNESVCAEVNQAIFQSLAHWSVEKDFTELAIVEGYHAPEFDGLPVIISRLMAHDIRLYRQLGFRSIFCEQANFSEPGVGALMHYQFAQQTWRSDVSLDSLQTEFFFTYYAGVSGLMQEYYRMIEEAFANITAWRYELAKKLEKLAKNNFRDPLLPLDQFSSHFQLQEGFADENRAVGWERTYQLVNDARHLLDEALQKALPDEVQDHLIEEEKQLQFTEMTINLYDNIIRVLTLGDDEPEMREEAAIRLQETMRKMTEFPMPKTICKADNALKASGIAQSCQKICEEMNKPASGRKN